MSIKSGFSGAVGNTPLIRLNAVSEQTGCEILGKAEFMNPGGSVKDRAALYIIKAAEESGELRPGGTVVEGTAGNTGIGLAHICNARGYKCVIYIPETQSREKIDLLRALGAEVRAVPAVPYKDPNNYQKQAGRYAAELDNAIWANQFDNTANREGHYLSTGPEIWQQTEGNIDAFTCSTGTGGTLGGVSRYLKEKNPDISIVLADPQGSALYHYYTRGELKVVGDNSISEGIGTSRLTENLADSPVDDAILIEDSDAVSMVYHLLYREGLFMGASTGVNVCAAVEVATRLGPGHRIVTILCDTGRNYQSRLFNPEWLSEKGLAPGHDV